MNQIPTVLLSIENSRSYGRGILRGISKYTHVHGQWIFMTVPNSYRSGGIRGSMTSRFNLELVDGVIMRENKKLLQQVLSLDIPVIVACHISGDWGLPSIMTDCNAIGQMAAEYLLNRGFKKFAFCGERDMFWSERRKNSFTSTLANAGYEVHCYQQPIAKKYRLWREEGPVLIEWLKKLPKPIAIMAPTDDRAIDVIDACRIGNIHVPEEVAVLGVDNDDLVCSMAGVLLSSVGLNTQKAGYEAAELMHCLIKGEEAASNEILIQPSCVTVRRSTDIFNIKDECVAKAINFIHSHVNEPLQVCDIEKEVMLSDRNLYDRFKKELGRTVSEEITRVRIEKICKLLEDTSFTTIKIAQIMGLENDRHLSRYFRRQKNMTPSAWRKQKTIG